MPEKIAFKEYFSTVKNFISTKYNMLRQYIKPYLQTLALQTALRRENVIKLLIPLLLIFLGFHSCSSLQRQVSRNISDIFLLSDDIRSHYTGKPDYWGLSTAKVLQENLIPAKFIRDGKLLLSSGEEIFVGTGKEADIVMPRMTTFDIILPHLNKAQCIAYAENKISMENQVKLQQMSIVNATGIYSFEWGAEKYSLPLKKYASKDICDNSDNVIIWTIR